MTAAGQSPGISAAEVYRGFIEAVNRQDLEAAAAVRGRRPLPRELRRVHPRVRGLGASQGIGPPGLEGPSRPAGRAGAGPRRRRCRPRARHGPRDGDRAAVRGAGHQALVSRPASSTTSGSTTGQIIERVQQADVLGQMRQLYGKALGLVGLDAMFLRL